MNYFVTGGDRGYVFKAVCLMRSFLKQKKKDAKSHFIFYAYDNEAEQAMRSLALPGIQIVKHEEFATPRLREVSGSRTVQEYCQTAKPVALKHAMQQSNPSDWVIWIDGDMLFFADPERIIPAATGSSAFITPHFYTKSFQHYEDTVGKTNSGVVGFNNAAAGREALNWWEDRCIEWCGATPEPENKRYTDQYYVDFFPEKFSGVHVNASLGINAAPWNAIERPLKAHQEKLYLEKDEIILFHFQGLKILGPSRFDLYPPALKLPAALREKVYQPYIEVLTAAIAEVRKACPGYSYGFKPLSFKQWLKFVQRFALNQSNITL